MHSDMIRLVAFDFILRLIFSGMMSVALVIRVSRMDFDNPAADVPGLGIPSDVIALFETFSHLILANAQRSKPVQHPTLQLTATKELLDRREGSPAGCLIL
jgi:hypothetical protein